MIKRDPRAIAQTEKILEHLRIFGTITPLQARELYGCDRLGARIWDLKRAGCCFTEPTKLIEVGNGKRVAQYELAKIEASGQVCLL